MVLLTYKWVAVWHVVSRHATTSTDKLWHLVSNSWPCVMQKHAGRITTQAHRWLSHFPKLSQVRTRYAGDSWTYIINTGNTHLQNFSWDLRGHCLKAKFSNRFQCFPTWLPSSVCKLRFLMHGLPSYHSSPPRAKVSFVRWVSRITKKTFLDQNIAEALLADAMLKSSKGSSHSAILPARP